MIVSETASEITIEPHMEGTACWYLVHTKPASEATAEVHLERQGYRVYYPRLAQAVRRRGHWVDRIAALFPRYMFLQLNVGSQSLKPVQSTMGVAAVVRFGQTYAVVSDEVVARLQERADPGTGLHRLCRSAHEPGAKVRIIAGAFDGLEGIFQRESGDERALVLLKLLGQESSVQVPAEFVVPVVESFTDRNTRRRELR